MSARAAVFPPCGSGDSLGIGRRERSPPAALAKILRVTSLNRKIHQGKLPSRQMQRRQSAPPGGGSLSPPSQSAGEAAARQVRRSPVSRAWLASEPLAYGSRCPITPEARARSLCTLAASPRKVNSFFYSGPGITGPAQCSPLPRPEIISLNHLFSRLFSRYMILQADPRVPAGTWLRPPENPSE